MYNYIFSEEKNIKLKAERGLCFDMIIQAINDGKLIRTLKNKQQYENQMLFIIEINSYAYVVPFILNKEKKEIVLKTIFPSRKMTKLYLENRNEH
ncbi:MAG: toxin [Rickettsiaceae bacterium]|jgi:hypothetical protein|nr:toxin [Rickettsiaceae bacterium]